MTPSLKTMMFKWADKTYFQESVRPQIVTCLAMLEIATMGLVAMPLKKWIKSLSNQMNKALLCNKTSKMIHKEIYRVSKY